MKYIFLLGLLFLVACSTAEEINETVEMEDEPVEVDTTPTKIDLIPEVNTDTLYPEQGQEMKLLVTLSNKGFQKINDTVHYTVKLSKDGEILQEASESIEVYLLASTSELIYESSYVFDMYGTYTLEAEVDTTNAVNEMKEDNNKKSVRIFLRDPATIEEEEEDTDDEEAEEEEESEDTSTGCTDTDGGKEYGKVGTCTDQSSFQNGRTDFCTSDDTLAELYCGQTHCEFDIKECSNVCSEGTCI